MLNTVHCRILPLLFPDPQADSSSIRPHSQTVHYFKLELLPSQLLLVQILLKKSRMDYIRSQITKMSAIMMRISNSGGVGLLELPLEIQLSIIDHLGFPEKPLLRIICCHFHNLIKWMTHEDIFGIDKKHPGAERHPSMVKKRYFGCKECLRLRPASKFADSMVTGRKGKFGKEPETRFCINCGTRPPRDGSGPAPYIRGVALRIDGQMMVFCLDCGKLRTQSEHWKLGRYCQKCSLRRPDRSPTKPVLSADVVVKKFMERNKNVVMENGDLIDLGNSVRAYLEGPEKSLLD